jgi:signal transduction histidine kinase
MMDKLYNLQIFAELPEAELHWIANHSRDVYLETGEYFFRENGPADQFYVVLEGELQISRQIDGVEKALGTTPPGIIGGEISLLNDTPSNISACAIVPSRLIVLDQQKFREMFAYAPILGSRVLQIAAGRTQGFTTTLIQQEKMAALGRLSAGLAHELNNPAAAARRAASTLRDLLPVLQGQAVKLNALGLTDAQLEQLTAFKHAASERAATAQPLSPLEQSDREDELVDWLESLGIDAAWEMASGFVGATISRDELANLIDVFPSGSLPEVLAWLQRALEATNLLNEISQSTSRISELVGAIKSYTYRDQGAVQDVDIHQGLENTLVVLKYKLKKGRIQVIREYDPALPHIQARGSELNQVWTNLIDNAIDALDGDGVIRLITRYENQYVMVEVTDNGPGIPPEIKPRIFEPFFTTKEVGAGTGLGLDISYRIIHDHHGFIEVLSEPGETRFIVRLPIGDAETPAT